MNRKRGSNKYQYKYRFSPDVVKSIIWVAFITAFLILSVLVCKYRYTLSYMTWRDRNVLAPCPNFCAYAGEIIVPDKKELTVDELVDKYANKYGKTKFAVSRTKAMIHYLLLRESNYGATNKCGDSGLACGVLQYHLATYKAYRAIMIKRELTDHIGSRLNIEDAIETTAWAINDGREMAWGPLARGEGF